jgi:hypothetical protein
LFRGAVIAPGELIHAFGVLRFYGRIRFLTEGAAHLENLKIELLQSILTLLFLHLIDSGCHSGQLFLHLGCERKSMRADGPSGEGDESYD